MTNQTGTNALVCDCGHTHGQHIYSDKTHTARCNVLVNSGGYITREGKLTGNYCPCEVCTHKN